MYSNSVVTGSTNWRGLSITVVITAVCALSVHVVMLQVLHVPSPAGYPSQSWLEQINQIVAVFSILLLVAGSRTGLIHMPFVARVLVLFLVLSMLKESLIRSWLMTGVTTTAYLFPFLANLPQLLVTLILSLVCVAVAPHLRLIWQRFVAASAIYALIFVVLQPAINKGAQVLLGRVAWLAHSEVYHLPYGAHVVIPAYATFLEPVIACFIGAWLVWDGLSVRPVVRMAQFVLIILSIRRVLLAPFIYSFHYSSRWASALASMGQYSLEVLTMALLAAVSWELLKRNNHGFQI